ncbi:glycosyltransferase family 4 protein [Pseudomonas sp. GCM10022186]|uniref:glycosyltransferase family 4 protein n=1 Tax=Pseudomonas sp. GCM10022186 TaxID=3252650 RepID=UPI00361DD0FF
MKIAFTIFGGTAWTGGINYLSNILSAISESPSNNLEPVLFHAPDADPSAIQKLAHHLSSPPITIDEWGNKDPQKLKARVASILCNSAAERHFTRQGIDVVFQSGVWYGLLFPIPTLAWIPDFQHKHLPYMFGRLNNLKRDIGYAALSHSATRILVSSEDARKDCETFLPKSRSKISVLPFSVKPSTEINNLNRAIIAKKYSLPQKYFYLPNQFWKHKNHTAVLEALRHLKHRGRKDIAIAVTGNPNDFRNPEHPRNIFDAVERNDLSESFRFLGMIPYEDISLLIRGSIAVINPSLFEGWSTTVEEAKSLGAPLILSDLPVHREQAGSEATYFDPHDPIALADILINTYDTSLSISDKQRLESEFISHQKYLESRKNFSLKITEIFKLTASSNN